MKYQISVENGFSDFYFCVKIVFCIHDSDITSRELMHEIFCFVERILLWAKCTILKTSCVKLKFTKSDIK